MDTLNSSSSGPLRRNQACHQCRARKLKCDAGRPCTTCRRSHAKAIAPLTAAGQSVLADPNCTYDYAPGEDPWTATFRTGLGLRPQTSSGSVSPANSANDARLPHSSSYPGSSFHRTSPHQSQNTFGSSGHSPHYPPSSQGSLYPYASARGGSSMPSGMSVNPGAFGAVPAAHPQHSAFGPVPPYVSPHSRSGATEDLDYEEMADMLYERGPMFDETQSLFPPQVPFASPYLAGTSLGAGPALHAHYPSGTLLSGAVAYDANSGASPYGAGIQLHEAYNQEHDSPSTHARSSHSRSRRQ